MKYNILFIDDEPASLTAFRSVFRDYYEIFTAVSAEEGYKLMQNHDINIVISDQRMPGITGVDFLQRIRLEYPETVRMLVTGYSDIDAVIKSINGSMISYYFSKPYDENEMKVILDSAVEKIQLIRENQILMDKLKDMVDQLTEARERAEESSRLKSSLLSNLNHEFRTPMNGILGFSELLMDFPISDQGKEFARFINASANRLFRTLNNIVDLARFEADQKLPDTEDLNLSEITNSILRDFEEIAIRKHLRFTSEVEPGIRIHFVSSFAGLIINNLLDNAIKFTKEGEIRLKLELTTKQHQPVAQLSVMDTGIGIPDEFREKIFEDFKQVSDGYGRSFEGLGIGLSLCKKILNQLNGDIQSRNNENQGTVFTVTIPAVI